MTNLVQRDMDIQRDILDELSFDPEVEPADIGVSVNDGAVTLTGTVKNYIERWAAERAAFRVSGVHAIANEIVVKPAGTGVPDDSDIAKAIVAAFEHNLLVPPDVRIHVSHGGVTIEGKAAWQYQRTAAEHVARTIRGVRWVSNQIEVEQPNVAPQDIEHEIKQALMRNAAVDADHVHVAVHDRELTLSGTVRSWAEREEAEAAAWRAKGVTAVANKISVRPPAAL